MKSFLRKPEIRPKSTFFTFLSVAQNYHVRITHFASTGHICIMPTHLSNQGAERPSNVSIYMYFI